jgi:hypothetical protein
MGLQAAVHLGHTPWALMKEEEDRPFVSGCTIFVINLC